MSDYEPPLKRMSQYGEGSSDPRIDPEFNSECITDNDNVWDLGVPPHDTQEVDIRGDEDPIEEIVEYSNEVPSVKWELIEESQSFYHEKFHRHEKRAVFKLSHNFYECSNISAFKSAIDEAYEEAIAPILANAKKTDLFTVKIENTSLNYDMFISPEPVFTFKKERFLDVLQMVVQSNRNIFMDGILKVRVAIYESMKGGAGGQSL